MLTLRPYQVRTVRQVHDALRRHQRIILCLSTGSGKRILACWWAAKIAEKGRKLLVVTDRQILVNQMADECKKHGIEFGVLMGDAPRNDFASVQVASIQTIRAREFTDLPEADWLVIDECHRESAAYQVLFDYRRKAKVVGLTATPVGAQGKTLVGLYDDIVEPISNTDLIQGGWLLPTQVWCPSEPDTKGVSIDNGKEFNQKQLGERVEECTVFADVFKWWEPYAATATIVFCPRLRFARGIAEQFRQRGFSAVVIEGATSTSERRDILRDFQRGNVNVLVSVDVLTTGFDAPHAGCGIDLQPNHQFRSYWQKLGRIKRPHPGQDKAVWLDFAGNFWRFPHPDENPDWGDVTSKISTQDVISKKREAGEAPKPWSCHKCSYTRSPGERIDGKCPNCGAIIRKPKKRIRMKDGTLKTVSVEQKKKVKASREQAAWDAARYKAHYSGKTLDFARWLYKQDMGEYPPSGLKACPEPDSGDWKRRPSDVYVWMGRRK